MTDLESKFQTFEQQVATQHTALVNELAATNAKLDTMITLLGGAPPTPTITLESVVQAIEATNGILTDMHADTISMDQKLLRIRDAINPLDEALPTEARSSIPWLLFRIMDAIQPAWPRATSVPLQPAMHLLLALAQEQYPQLTHIHAALGNPTGDATTTALGYLSSIGYSNSGIYNSIGASTGDDDTVIALLQAELECACSVGGMGSSGGTCLSPFRSTGMQLIPFTAVGGSNVIVATWTAPLPSGISFGTLFGLADQYAELYSADWSGWQVLVQSDEQQYADSATSTTRYPTGVWRALPSGPANYSWAVSDRGSIQVSLCSPSNFNQSGEPAECVQITVAGSNSEIITADITISRPVTVRYISGSTPVAIHPNLHNGDSRSVYANIGVLSSAGQVSPVISAYTLLGFSVGSTTASVIIEVCPAELS